MLREHFVSVALDCDRVPEDLRRRALEHLPHLRALPFIFLVDAEGRWLGGSTGSTTSEALKRLIDASIAARATTLEG
jgi:hypothetical protein